MHANATTWDELERQDDNRSGLFFKYNLNSCSARIIYAYVYEYELKKKKSNLITSSDSKMWLVCARNKNQQGILIAHVKKKIIKFIL